jgi:hypothetical protein
MKLHTAWAIDPTDSYADTAHFLTAFDEVTFDNWGKTPDFYADEVAKARKQGLDVREIVFDLPTGVIFNLFEPPVVDVTVVES